MTATQKSPYIFTGHEMTQKSEVQAWWNSRPCGTTFTDKEKFTPQYFAQIEDMRYRLEPYIHSFAQFTRYRGKKILEVGVGAGTDFAQWVRAGTLAYGIDLTPEGIAHTRKRLELESLRATELKLGDAETIDYPDNSFDLVYSWGVIHHSPDPVKAFCEIVRVTKPGGDIKIMIYNRHSITACMVWFRRCFLSGRPWKSLKYALAHYVESPGTQAYTKKEAMEMCTTNHLTNIKIDTLLTWCDTAALSRFKIIRQVYQILCFLAGSRAGWFMLIHAKKHK